MGDNSMHIFIPFIGLAANVLIQVAVFRFFPRMGLLRSLFFGFACGFLVSLLIKPGVTSANNLVIYVLLGYCYFHFVNMGETARRIRILTELANAREGLSLREILERYNSKDIIDQRLDRLVNNGQVIYKNGKYYIGKPAMLAIAGVLAAAKRLIFGRTDKDAVMSHDLPIFKTETSRTLFLSAVIIVLGGFAYLNSLLNPLIWDDAFLISTNLHIRSLGYIPGLFFENVYHQDMIGRFYRPILMASFALDYHQWGLDPFGYHISNILIHLGNALLVYSLIRLIFRRELLAFLTAMLFVLHPVQTEAVTYISGRADPLAAFFCLLALYFFITYVDFGGYRRRLYFGASLLSFLLALFSKESAAAFPLMLIFYETCFRKGGLKGKKSAKYAFYVAILLIYGVIRHFILLNVKGTLTASGSLPLLDRLCLVPSIILTYIKLLLFPKGLHMERSDFLFERPHYFFDHRVVFALSVLTAIAVFVWLMRKRRREALFGFGWFILLLIPVLNIIPINAFIAEHWLYLPSVGFFLLCSSALIGLFRFGSIKLCIASFMVVILAMLCTLTIRQNYIWRDPVSFYKYTLKFSPLSTRLRTNLGVEYFSLGLYKDAEREYRAALAAEPKGTNAANDYINLGAALYWQGKKKESMEAYNNAIKLRPDSPLGYWFKANILYLDNQTKSSIGFYKKAAELMPSNAPYWLSLGNAYQKEKDFKEAEEAYGKALAAYPAFFEARINMGTVYFKQGLLKDAFEEYRKALKLDPESPEAYYNIGNVSAAIGKTEEAKKFWQEALKKDPNHAGAKKKLEKTGSKK